MTEPEPMALEREMELAMQHHQQGRLAEAEMIYRRVLAEHPDHVAAMHLLGAVAFQSGNLAAAVELIQRAVELRPDLAGVRGNLGLALVAIGRLDQAISQFEQSLAMSAGDPYVWMGLGNALQLNGQPARAAAAFREALKRKPDLADAWNNLSVSLCALGSFDEASAACRRAIELRPGFSEAHNNLAMALQKSGALAAALDASGKAVELRQDFPEAWNQLGITFRESGDYGKAIEAFDRAISNRPQYPEAHHNKAEALRDRGSLDEAIGEYLRALALRPDMAETHFMLGTTHLLQGEYRRGWPEFEWRRRIPRLRDYFLEIDKPQWNGGSIEGKRILLHAEQGFGDAIQFARFITPLAKARNARVIVSCFAPLVRLFRSIEGVESVIPQGEQIPQFDEHCPLLSLPLVLATTLQTIPGDVPYLKAEAQLAQKWRERISGLGGRLKVGLAWSGRVQPNPWRSVPAEALSPLLDVSDVSFLSIQKKDEIQARTDSSVALHSSSPPLTDWTDELQDFADTAALIESLDLVITIDTAVAHLAGALGKRAWVLLPSNADWRWLRDQSRTPWYPTMQLFRQQQLGNWTQPIAEIAQQLRSLPPSHE